MKHPDENGRPTLGTWLSIGSPVVAELAADSGFGWLLFDLEHGCALEDALLGQLQATRGTAAQKIVRVGAPHPDLIARVLDWGADGIMVPHVNSAAEAERCVEAMFYPPRGRRGFSRTVRAYGYGLRAPQEGEFPPAPRFLAQIESLEGVEQAKAIAAVPGVDVLFVGPADLRFDLNARQATRSYEDCLAVVIDAAREAGKAAGILVRDVKDLPGLRQQGFTWLAIDSDLAILREKYRQIVALAQS
jgi:2-dehydro-3-deoxyglucarate aldolase/4-hydroxy-2-oxoheptanedioate aldolase